MIKALAIICLAASLHALDSYTWRIDEPSKWYDPRTSHHLQHAIGGAAIGALGWTGAKLCGADRLVRVWSALGTGVVVGIAFEYQQANDHGAIVDPVDIGWTVAGAAVSALICEAGLHFLTVHTNDDSLAVGIAMKF